MDIIRELKRVVGSVIDEPINITIQCRHPRTFRGVQGEEFHFKLYPLTVGNVYRISALIKSLPESMVDNLTPEGINSYMHDHIANLVSVVAIGLQNDRNAPEEDLLALINDECSFKDIVYLFEAIMSQMDVQSFINSIILIKGADVLKAKSAEVSPVRSEEIIAS